MNKEIYLIRGIDQESYPDFYSRIFNMTSVLVKELNPEALKFTITLNGPPGISIIPFRRTKIAAISIYKSDRDRLKNSGKQMDFAVLTG